MYDRYCQISQVMRCLGEHVESLGSGSQLDVCAVAGPVQIFLVMDVRICWNWLPSKTCVARFSAPLQAGIGAPASRTCC